MLNETGKSTSREDEPAFPLTVKHEETLAESLLADAVFRREYLARVVESMLEGDLAVGQDMLRSYVLATMGFDRLERHLDIFTGSLECSLTAEGKPLAEHVFRAISYLEQVEGSTFEVLQKAA